MSTKVFERLSRSVFPTRYFLEIKPCFKTFNFTGTEKIHVEVVDQVSTITINGKDLKIDSAKYNGKPMEVSYQPEQEKITFQSPTPLLKGSGIMDISFSGIANGRMEGFYKSDYTSATGEKKIMFATQFEPTGARLAFPCWDEPLFKAVYNIKLVVPRELTALSNMPIASQIDLDGNLIAYQYEETPKMSSYLVAYAIGDLEYVEGRDANNILIRVYSRKGLVCERGLGDFALKTACKSLPFYGEYFGVQYPLPKCDLLAIPDFCAGAMENWGLITYRESALLVEKETGSASSKERVALTTCHELAHMWFGNFVTMKWWTDLWLKEGFATWIEYLCVAYCYPEMNIWSHFTYSEWSSALHLDALTSSHPIEVEVSSPDEIDEIFDAISYKKGASLINMLFNYLGEAAFKAGLQAYQAKFAYKNAVTADLYACLSEASSVDVGQLMQLWSRAPGFPVLSVEPVSLDAANKELTVKLSQSTFSLPPTKAEASRVWHVPVTLTCCSPDGKHSTTFKCVFKTASESVKVPLTWAPVSLDDCVVHANKDASGYYRVAYTSSQMHRIVKLIASSSSDASTVSSRIAFANDAIALTRAGLIPASDLIKIIPALLKHEMAYPVWACLLNDGLMSYVHLLLQENGQPLDAFNELLRRITVPVLEKLGFFNSQPSDFCKLSHNDGLLLARLIGAAGARAGDPRVVEQVKRWFNDQCDGKVTLPSDLRGVVYTTAVRHSDSPLQVVEKLIKRYSTSMSPDEESHIRCALAAAPLGTSSQGDPTGPLERVVTFILDRNGPIRNQDKAFGLSGAASWSPEARAFVWKTVQREWAQVRDIYPGPGLLGRLIQGVLSDCVKTEETDAIKAFFEANPVPCVRVLSQLMERIATNHALSVRDTASITQTIDLLIVNNGNAGGANGSAQL